MPLSISNRFKKLGKQKIYFEFSENFPTATATNPVGILENPEIGVHLYFGRTINVPNLVEIGWVAAEILMSEWV